MVGEMTLLAIGSGILLLELVVAVAARVHLRKWQRRRPEANEFPAVGL